jgi:hypothetical protein
MRIGRCSSRRPRLPSPRGGNYFLVHQSSDHLLVVGVHRIGNPSSTSRARWRQGTRHDWRWGDDGVLGDVLEWGSEKVYSGGEGVSNGDYRTTAVRGGCGADLALGKPPRGWEGEIGRVCGSLVERVGLRRYLSILCPRQPRGLDLSRRARDKLLDRADSKTKLGGRATGGVLSRDAPIFYFLDLSDALILLLIWDYK